MLRCCARSMFGCFSKMGDMDASEVVFSGSIRSFRIKPRSKTKNPLWHSIALNGGPYRWHRVPEASGCSWPWAVHLVLWILHQSCCCTSGSSQTPPDRKAEEHTQEMRTSPCCMKPDPLTGQWQERDAVRDSDNSQSQLACLTGFHEVLSTVLSECACYMSARVKILFYSRLCFHSSGFSVCLNANSKN